MLSIDSQVAISTAEIDKMSVSDIALNIVKPINNRQDILETQGNLGDNGLITL